MLKTSLYHPKGKFRINKMPYQLFRMKNLSQKHIVSDTVGNMNDSLIMQMDISLATGGRKSLKWN